MKGGQTPQGFTIIETLIFLAVSAGLFVSATLLVSGQQRKAEFSYGVQEFGNRVQDIINDVSTGFYESSDNFGCRESGSNLSFTGTGILGERKDCIFLGRVIQFAPSDAGSGDPREYIRIFTVAGRRQLNGKETINLTESFTTPISPRYGADASLTTEEPLPYGLSVRWVRVGGGGANINAVGFFSNFVNYQAVAPGGPSSRLLDSNARNIDLIPINGSAGIRNEFDMAGIIASSTAGSARNPAQGIIACLESGGTDFHMLLNIGGNLRQQTTNVEIRGGDCPA